MMHDARYRIHEVAVMRYNEGIYRNLVLFSLGISFISSSIKSSQLTVLKCLVFDRQ
jgi:hypothetical protein